MKFVVQGAVGLYRHNLRAAKHWFTVWALDDALDDAAVRFARPGRGGSQMISGKERRASLPRP